VRPLAHSAQYVANPRLLATRPAIDFAHYVPSFAAIVLLVAEVLYLTFRFDTQSLDHSPSIYAQLLGWSPQYLRLATTVGVLTLLVSGKDLVRGVTSCPPPATSAWRLPALIAHGGLLIAFTWVTSRLLEADFASLGHPAVWTLTWLVTGTASFIALSLSVFPPRTWLAAAEAVAGTLPWAFLAGVVVWAGGFLTEELWVSLARYTFAVVQWILHFIYPVTVSDASRLMVGTPAFKVFISPECSGYEGVGLIVAFLSIYLWLFRKDLRFPAALALLPLGAATIWIVNALRIVALVTIGTSGWPAVARGGFHSQAGWLAFNAVALAFVGLTMRGRCFQLEPKARAELRDPDTGTAAYVGPFAAITATAMLTGAVSGGFDWLYPVRVMVAVTVLWMFRKSYSDLKWSWSWSAFAIGFATFVIWLALLPSGVSSKDLWPAALESVPLYWAGLWLGVRAIGYVITVPLVEELAFRGFLSRRIVQADFEELPLGRFSWASFLISSLLFGALHGGLWVAGTVAGMGFALALYRRGALGDAVQAHATTNGLLMLYAIVTGRWSVWS
jgi:exosortase E/protease (VPEID-CTERM system)